MSEYGMDRQYAIWGLPIAVGVSLVNVCNARAKEQDSRPAPNTTGLEALHDLRMSQYAPRGVQ